MAPAKKTQRRKQGKKALENMAKENYFDVETLHDILIDGFDGTVDPKASVFFMGVMQYIATEIIEVTGNAAKENVAPGASFTITPSDILRGLESDEELKKVFNAGTKALVKKTKEKH